MINVGTGLESVKMGDAFVNAWDVANKVSDLLMIKMDRELCDCAGDMSKFMNKEGSDNNGKSGSVFFCRFIDASNSNSNSISDTHIYSNAKDNNSETDDSSDSKKKKSKNKNITGIDSSSSGTGSSSSSSSSMSPSKLNDKSKPTIDLSGFLQTTVTRSVLTHQVQGLAQSTV